MSSSLGDAIAALRDLTAVCKMFADPGAEVTVADMVKAKEALATSEDLLTLVGAGIEEAKPPFFYTDFETKKQRKTMGRFSRWTKGGPLDAWYAVFEQRSGATLVPEYLLSLETKRRLPRTPEAQTKAEQAFLKLLRFVPESSTAETYDGMFSEDGTFGPDDEGAPFVSETFLYAAIGKEDARTFLALLKRAMASVGLNMDELERKADEAPEVLS